MKKRKTNLSLNKKLIAKLIDPTRIVGGEEDAEAGDTNSGNPTGVDCFIDHQSIPGLTVCLCAVASHD